MGTMVASFDVTGGNYVAANFTLSADPAEPSNGNLVVSYAATTPTTATLDLAMLSPTAGIPEPSTWAMMLVGFAGLGWAGHCASRRNVIKAT
jgi:PEP-CTERM motif